ncbi:MAG: hypothetical protein HY042_08840, partial [Spirochaetia bacterium]|nr:hypothetical protein [Spirochaetia bacterium]
MKFLRRSATITLVLMSLYCGSKGQNQSLALLPFLGTGSVGVSPSTAGAGQPVATGGATAAADMENPASVQAAVPAGAASGDHTPPRLLRMEWPTTCTMTGAGWLRCDPKPTGPIFVFDKPIDCASAPKLNGHTIENGGTIKAYSLRASYTNGMGYDHYIIDGDYQSIAIVSECDANKVRVHPVIDEHQQGVGGPIEGGFMPNTYTVVLAGGIKDTAGNATLDGDSRFAGPVGDVRSNTEMDTVINSPYAVDVVTYVGPAAIRANTYDYLADFILMPWIDQRPTTDGKLRFLMPSFPVACDDLNLIRSNFLIETVLWDDFKAGRPFQTFPIQGVACEPVEGLNHRLVITNPIPVGSLVRITVQGTFTNSQKNMTMGSGRFMQLFENVNGVSQPIPRSFRYMQWRWPENLGTQPSCQTLEVDQAVTYFDSAQTYGPYCADAAGPFLQPNTSKPEYYFYIGGGMPALNTGYCVEYSGPAWSSTDAALAKLEKNCSTVIPGLPQSFQKYNGPRFAEYASCETSAGVISGYGTSYFDTGVAGVCIENPGKTNEYAIYYFNYEDKVAARTVCKGLW